ncbi:MAG: RNA-binding protein [Elusimicrobiota bacterium]
MGKSIFIGSLSYETTEKELAALFGTCGRVTSVRILKDRATCRSRGIGFVEMSSEAEVKAAIEKLNGCELGGRKIFTSVSDPNEKRPPKIIERRSGKDRRRSKRAPARKPEVDPHIRKWSARHDGSGPKKPGRKPGK